MKSIRVLAVLGAALLGPAAAAQAATMYVSSSVFPGGAPAPDGVSGKVHVAPGSHVKLSAPKYLYVPGTSTAPPTVYQFIFWDVNAKLRLKETAAFTAGSGTFVAGAWYLPTGGGPCVAGGCIPDITTWMFSLYSNTVVPSRTPISAVTPAGAWTKGSTSVSTTDAAALAAGHVHVTAASQLGLTPLAPPSPRAGYYSFGSWFQFVGNAHINGINLRAPAGGDSDSIAFYRFVPGIVLPPPCSSPPCPLPM